MTKVFWTFLDYFLDDEECDPENPTPNPKEKKSSNSTTNFLDRRSSHNTKTPCTKGAPKPICKICNKTFDDAFFLRVHEIEHINVTDGAQFSISRMKKTPISCVCSICNESFDDAFQLRVHSFEHVDLSSALPAAFTKPTKKTSDFVCTVCQETFDDEFFLRVHSYEHVDMHKLIEQPKPLLTTISTSTVCNVCGTEFEDALSLRVHVFDHQDKYFCAVCEVGLKTYEELCLHYKDHSQMELWKVREKLPKKLAGTIKEHYYEACSEKFVTDPPKPRVYSNTKKRKKRKTRCEICGAIMRSSSLREHRMMHEGTKRHPCQVCGKKFLRIADAKKHSYLMHSERTRPTCDICGKTMSSATSLHRHKLAHVNDRKFGCELCDRKFLSKYELRKHYMVHTGEKPFVCDVCGVSMRKGYRQHMARHGVHVESRRSVPTNMPPKSVSSYSRRGRILERGDGAIAL